MYVPLHRLRTVLADPPAPAPTASSRGEPPRIAIVTDWITDMGGVARVDLALHEAFPEAPIFTSVYEPDALAHQHFDGLDIRTTWLQRLPRRLRKLQRLFPALRVKAFRDLDLSEFDIIISSSSAESKQVRKTREDQLHICYCHTPIRYYWSHYREYKKDPGLGRLNWLARLAMPVLVPRLKKADYDAAQAVDVFLANSTEVQARIERYYDKPSTVVHPPVDTDRFTGASRPPAERVGYLAHGRQVPYKRIDLAVAACTALGLPLTVSGQGPENEKLKAQAGDTVTFVSGLSDEQVADLFGRSRAFIFPAEEDFGIVQVEALAAGTPVVAFASGGSQDIVRDGEGGVTFSRQDVLSLQDALLEMETRRFDPEVLQGAAQRFHTSLFVREMRRVAQRWWERTAAVPPRPAGRLSGAGGAEPQADELVVRVPAASVWGATSGSPGVAAPGAAAARRVDTVTT